MVIKRAIKKWGGGDSGGTSHHWEIEIDLENDLHRSLRPGKEIDDALVAIQLVDQLLISYVLGDRAIDDTVIGPGPVSVIAAGEDGAEYRPGEDFTRR